MLASNDHPEIFIEQSVTISYKLNVHTMEEKKKTAFQIHLGPHTAIRILLFAFPF